MKEKDTRMKNKTRKLEHWQVVTLLLMLYDFTAVALSYCLAYGYGLTANSAE